MLGADLVALVMEQDARIKRNGARVCKKWRNASLVGTSFERRNPFPLPAKAVHAKQVEKHALKIWRQTKAKRLERVPGSEDAANGRAHVCVRKSK